MEGSEGGKNRRSWFFVEDICVLCQACKSAVCNVLFGILELVYPTGCLQGRDPLPDQDISPRFLV